MIGRLELHTQEEQQEIKRKYLQVGEGGRRGLKERKEYTAVDNSQQIDIDMKGTQIKSKEIPTCTYYNRLYMSNL